MIHGVLVLVNCMKNNNLAINIFFAIAIALSIILVGKLKPQDKPAIAETAPKVETVREEEELPNNPQQKDRTSTPLSDRPLRMSISVDNPSFLKVRLNDEIKIGDVISDNSNERQRLDRQKKAIKLQIDNLNAKTLIAPTPPPPTKSLRERGLNSPPGINNILWTFLLTWVTPGLSLSATTSALIAPGAYRLIIANLTSVAIEGWNLGLLFRDGSSTKTPLADLLLRPDRWYQTPTLQVSGAGLDYLVFVVLLGVLPAIAVYLWCNSRFEPDPGVLVLVLLVQSVVLAGWSTLVLIPLGFGFAVLQLALMPNYSEIRSLTVMAPKLVP